jgi:hypothetical protein
MELVKKRAEKEDQALADWIEVSILSFQSSVCSQSSLAVIGFS